MSIPVLRQKIGKDWSLLVMSVVGLERMNSFRDPESKFIYLVLLKISLSSRFAIESNYKSPCLCIYYICTSGLSKMSSA